jgi:hypothetical protein
MAAGKAHTPGQHCALLCMRPLIGALDMHIHDETAMVVFIAGPHDSLHPLHCTAQCNTALHAHSNTMWCLTLINSSGESWKGYLTCSVHNTDTNK